MLKPSNDYRALYDGFQWKIPEFYNIGVAICDKWAGEPQRLALIYDDGKGISRGWTRTGISGSCLIGENISGSPIMLPVL